MQQVPRADALLTCARNLFRDQLMPNVPAEQRHAALMILNAMAIAARQYQNSAFTEADERARLQALLNEECDSPADGNQRLARFIRTGSADPGQAKREAVLEHLRQIGRRRVSESNPKALARTKG